MKTDGWWLPVAVIGLSLGIIYYNQIYLPSQGGPGLRPDRQKQCGGLSGTPEERLDACLGRLSRPSLSGNAESMIEKSSVDKSVLVLGSNLPASVEVDRILLSDRADLKKLLLATDEAAAAKAVRDSNVRTVVVHRDLTVALDRNRAVLSRLAHHDFIEWFQLRYVTDEVLIYTVRGASTQIPLRTGDDLLRGLRARIERRRPTPQRWKPDAVRLIGTMRLQGNSLVVRHAVGKDLEKTLDELAAKMVRRWERSVAVEGHGDLTDRRDEVRLEVQVVMERAPVEPRSRFAIFDLWEVGVDGMMFRQREGAEKEKFTYMPGSEAAVRSHKSADDFLRYAVDEDWQDVRPWEDDPRTRLDIIRTQHFMEASPGGGPAVRLFRGFPEVGMDQVTDTNVQQMLIDGAEWWVNNLKPDNSFEYKYWPTQNRRSTEYNEVRHILGARDLADAHRYRRDPRYAVASKRSMDWLMRYAVNDTDPVDSRLPHPPPGSMLFRYPKYGERKDKEPNQKLGTVAVGLLGWVAWAESTGSHDEDDSIRKMATFVLSQLQDNGKFREYYVPPDHPYATNKNDIVPGEAALALGMVAEYFDEPEWVDFYPKFLDYYEPWFRSRAKQTNPYGRWPHDTYANDVRLDLVQFGPWAVMASKQYYRLRGDERAAKFGLEIADWMIDNYQWSGERAAFPDYVGGYYKLPEELPAMQTFCYSEGTAAAYTIAALYNPDRKHKYLTSTQEAIRFMRVMQYDDLDSYFVADPDKVYGGVKYAINQNKIRTDYVGHGLSTLSQYLDARELDPAAELNVVDPELLGAEPLRRTLPLPPETEALIAATPP